MPRKKVYRDLTDEELFDIYHQNTEAENEFYRRYKEKVKWFLKRYRLRANEREDLIQEGMIGLFNAIETFDKSKNIKFSTYAGVCIRNRITNELSRLWSKNVTLDPDNEWDEVAIDSTPEENFIIGEISEKIQHAVLDLSEMEKRILSLYLDKKSYRQIAKELEISTKKVDNILMKVKSKLGEKVGDSPVEWISGELGNKLKNSIHRGLNHETKP